MSAQLRGLLTDLAADARDYADPDRAMSAARRAHVVRRAVVPLAAAVAVALAVGAPRAFAPDHQGSPPAGRGSAPAVLGYPAAVWPPDRSEPLPANAIVGAASFVYAPCIRSCDPYLVLPDGRQFRLARPTQNPSVAGYTLSPDGVWLGTTTTAGFELRNLVTGRTVSVPDDGPGVTGAWAWAPNSRSVLLGRHRSGAVDHYLVVGLADSGPATASAAPETATGASIRRWSVDALAGTVVALRNNGDVVRWLAGGDVVGSMPRLALTNPATGTDTQLTVSLPSPTLLRAGETIESLSLHLGPSSDSAILVIDGPAVENVARPTGFLETILTEGGRVTGRNDVPASSAAYGIGSGVWEVRANLPGGVVLLHSAPDRTEIVYQNDVNGTRSMVTKLPAESQVVLRSSARY